MKRNKAKTVSGMLSLALVLSLLGTSGQAGAAPAEERSGKAVVEAVCIHCHGSGKNGAPRIGDRAAWSKHASQGLPHVAENAITGIRKMPAHGGQPALSDVEMSRAIAYMISGGIAADPDKAYSSPLRMSGEAIVQERCRECHANGKNGAPRIGDMAAWTPRLKSGVDHLVKSAISGHNAMPARADRPSLSDAEIRAAVIYMVSQSASATLQK